MSQICPDVGKQANDACIDVLDLVKRLNQLSTTSDKDVASAGKKKGLQNSFEVRYIGDLVGDVVGKTNNGQLLKVGDSF